MVKATVRSVLAVLILMFVLSACPGFHAVAPQTPEKQYLAARMEFNNTLSRYLLYKSKETPEVQAEWTKKYDDEFEEAALILDAWGNFLSLGDKDAGYEKQMEFIEFKNTLIDMLADGGVFK